MLNTSNKSSRVVSKQTRSKLLKKRQNDIGGLMPSDVINRELSWLEFNRRVLEEALDERNPLLERVKFLNIFGSNLDEFFMKRVGGIKQQIAAGIIHQTADGMTPLEELKAIREILIPQLKLQDQCLEKSIKPGLISNSIIILNWKDLKKDELEFAIKYFRNQVFPILTPFAVDPGHPFPFLSNLSTSLGIVLRHPEQPEERLFARVKIPGLLPQLIRLETENGSNEARFVTLSEMISQHLNELFPGMIIMGVMPFRVTRNAEVELDALDAEDLLEHIQEELRERRFAKVIRLEHGANPDPWILNLLISELELSESDIYEVPSLLDFSALKAISELNLPKLRFEPWVPLATPILSDDDTNIFHAIRQGDNLVHHPYESFASSVEKLIKSAAEDPKVVAIKATLYRTGEESSIVPWLLRAAEAGKQVVCVIELKAHFDEARNIRWAQAMEAAGVHVIYGLLGIKTHAKMILIVREESDGMLCYAHIGTGNYHSQTANHYTDLGLFTANKDITKELVEVFNFLTGKSLKRDYSKLIVAPFNMKSRFIEMINQEITFAKNGKPALIIAKMNSLEDHGIIKALYEASKAGVKIDLIVRGLCCLKAGVPGLSENIRVISIIGRFLEHSRVFYFRNGAEDPSIGEFYLGSADWMYRNLLHRVEVITPVESNNLKKRLWEILEIMLSDFRQGWKMESSGKYIRESLPTEVNDASRLLGTHQILMSKAVPKKLF